MILASPGGIDVVAGNGGTGSAGTGGAGGSIMNSAFTQTGNGGNGGTISKILMNGLHSSFGIDSGNGGNADTSNQTIGAFAGSGGDISSIGGSVGLLYINGGSGGTAINGRAGAGASISDVKLTSVSEFVRAIAAGNGGTATGGFDVFQGPGGSVSHVSVPGAIGDFSSAFDTASITSGQGGLIVGTGGGGDVALNGSITAVSAKAVATIIAGRWDGTYSTTTGLGTTLAGLGTTRAVLSITGLSAPTIGADLFANGIVSDSTSAAWEVGDTHSLVDGIVLVQAALASAGPYTIGQQI